MRTCEIIYTSEQLKAVNQNLHRFIFIILIRFWQLDRHLKIKDYSLQPNQIVCCALDPCTGQVICSTDPSTKVCIPKPLSPG